MVCNVKSQLFGIKRIFLKYKYFCHLKLKIASEMKNISKQFSRQSLTFHISRFKKNPGATPDTSFNSNALAVMQGLRDSE